MNENNKLKVRRVPSPHSNAQRGQAIVIMAAVMVALIAMLGLAIDGGGVFFENRRLQNATDAAAIAAAIERCSGDAATDADVRARARESAATNGYDNNGVDNGVRIDIPPGPDAPAEVQNNSNYILVNIWKERPAYFIDIVYKEPLLLNSTAISFCRERFDPQTVPAIWAGGTDCGQQTVHVSGSSTEIYGGIHSNDGLLLQGSDAIITDDYGVGVTVADMSEANYDPTKFDFGEDPPKPGEIQDNPFYWLTIDLFEKGGAIALGAEKYLSIEGPGDDPLGDWSNAGGGSWNPRNRVLEGLYYVDGNVNIRNGITFGPEGASIVATGQIGWPGMDKGAEYTHYDGMYYEGKQVGIILYSDYQPTGNACAAKGITLSGSEMALFRGVIYAPYSQVDASFSKTNVIGQIVAYAVNLSFSDLYFLYQPSLMPNIPPSITMAD